MLADIAQSMPASRRLLQRIAASAAHESGNPCAACMPPARTGFVQPTRRRHRWRTVQCSRPQRRPAGRCRSHLSRAGSGPEAAAQSPTAAACLMCVPRSPRWPRDGACMARPLSSGRTDCCLAGLLVRLGTRRPQPRIARAGKPYTAPDLHLSPANHPFAPRLVRAF